VAGSNPAVPASRHRGLALATMPQDRLHAILCGEYVQLRHKVAEMNRTRHAREIGLIKLAGGFGDLRIMMDREYSRYFHERQTVLRGGHLPPSAPGRRTAAVRRLVHRHLKGVI
jgi:hypothetical protein